MVVDPWRNLFRSNVVLSVVEVVEIIDFSVSRFFSLNVVSHLLDPADFTFFNQQKAMQSYNLRQNICRLFQ